MLPDLPEPRSFHGCGLIGMFNSTFLVVFGGRKSQTTNHNSSILLLDLNNTQSGWKTDPSLKLDSDQAYINGNIVKGLNQYECDLMYITKTELHVCRGNFSWTVTQILPRTANKKGVPVGLNGLGSCANGLNN